MQPVDNGANLPARLFNDGANDVAQSVARGPESLGVSRETSEQIGAGFAFLLIVLFVLLFWRGYKRVGTFRRPPKRRKKRSK